MAAFKGIGVRVGHLATTVSEPFRALSRSLGPAIRQVVHGFRGENIALRASALTYITLLSLVPALAVVFAVVTSIGQDALRESMHQFIRENLAPSNQSEIVGYIDTFIGNARAGAVGGIGAVVLLFSAVSLLRNIEEK